MMSQTVSSHSELRKNFAHKTNRDGDFTATNVPWDWNEMDNMEEKRREGEGEEVSGLTQEPQRGSGDVSSRGAQQQMDAGEKH